MRFPDRRPFHRRLLDPVARAARRLARMAVPLAFLVALAWFAWRPEPPGSELRDGQAFAATVRWVADGDTLSLLVGPVATDTRLAGLDAPERDQQCRTRAGTPWACGQAARDALAKLLPKGTALDCTAQGIDRYSRTLATCVRADDRRDPARALVAEGLALAAPGGPYGDAEAAARAARRGLWQGPFLAPAEHRRQALADGTAPPPPGTSWLDRLLGRLGL